ncbi:MAG: sigma-70 family RNA polymerase sigma factor [Planctomycetota bacterium]
MTGEDEIGPELEGMVRRHGGQLAAIVGRMLGDPGRADDVCQDTWLALWRNRARLELEGRDPWPLIRRVGVRKALDETRRRRRGPAALEAPEGIPAPVIGASEGGETAGLLWGLADRERACLVLYFWEGLSVREIAEILECPEGSVKTWMHRGRRRLRERIEGGGDR